MDAVIKEILLLLEGLGWKNTLFNEFGITLESTSSGTKEILHINKVGVNLYGVKTITQSEWSLINRLQNKWNDCKDFS